METVFSAISHPFTWGLLLGLLIACFSVWNHWGTKRELKRYQKHLSDKMELEASQLNGLKRERDKLTKENENLRLRIGQLNEKPENKVQRELEILARAEKTHGDPRARICARMGKRQNRCGRGSSGGGQRKQFAKAALFPIAGHHERGIY